jgi:hypothetical protein
MLTLLPRKKRRDSNKRASTEPGAVHTVCGSRSIMRCFFDFGA